MVSILKVAIIMIILARGGEPGFVMIKEIDIPSEFEVILSDGSTNIIRSVARYKFYFICAFFCKKYQLCLYPFEDKHLCSDCFTFQWTWACGE